MIARAAAAPRRARARDRSPTAATSATSACRTSTRSAAPPSSRSCVDRSRRLGHRLRQRGRRAARRPRLPRAEPQPHRRAARRRQRRHAPARERLGMSEEGVRRQAAWKDGAYHDIVEYGLLASEWKERRSMSAEWGAPLFRDLQYCMRCCMPATNEGIAFDEFGVCQACQCSEHKMRIDWTPARRRCATSSTAPQPGRRLRLHHPDLRRQGLDLPAARDDAGLRAAAAGGHVQPQLVLQDRPRNLENALEHSASTTCMFTPNALAGEPARAPVAGQDRRLLLALPRRRRRLPAAGRGALERPADDLGRVDRRDLRPRVLPASRCASSTATTSQASRPRSTSTRWSPTTSSARRAAPVRAAQRGGLRARRPARHPPRRLHLLGRRAPDGVRHATPTAGGRPRRGHLQGLQERRVPDGRPARLHEVPQARLRPRHRPRQRRTCARA